MSLEEVKNSLLLSLTHNAQRQQAQAYLTNLENTDPNLLVTMLAVFEASPESQLSIALSVKNILRRTWTRTVAVNNKKSSKPPPRYR